MSRVAVLNDYQDVALSLGNWSSLPAGTEVVPFHEHIADPDALVAALHDFDIVVAMRERTAFPKSVIDRLPNLKLLVTTGVRNAAIDIDAATAAGITVSGTWGTPTPTAELAWGLILGLARHIPAEDATIRAGGWQQTVGTELAGRTLAVLGLGHLGKLVARVGQAFQMHVIAWSQNLTAERAAEAGVDLVTKDELFANADVLSIHLVLSDRTRHLVGEKELRAMKPTAFVVNTSRGPIIDTDALVRALHEGWIAGAGIDVFATEPLPADDPIRTAPHTILTPHIGYVSDKGYEVFFEHIVENIAGFLRGEPVRVLGGG